MSLFIVPTLLLFLYAAKDTMAGPQDPSYPELGESDRLANKIGWPVPEPYTRAGAEDKWYLVLQSKSRLDCPLVSGKKYECNNPGLSTTSTSISSQQTCQEWCEDRADTPTTVDSIEWQDSPYCTWDNSEQTCTLEVCNMAPVVTTEADFAYAACAENTDFVYESPLWESMDNDFEQASETSCDDTQVMRSDTSESPKCWQKQYKLTKGRNLLTEHYAKKKVTHVRIIMNGIDETYSVDNQRVGLYTLKDLVTSAGGSIFSEFDKSNDYASKRGEAPPWIPPTTNGIVACDHVGLNYLSFASANGNSVGESLLSARARIGVVMGKTVPCTARDHVQGVGIDVNYGAAAWKCDSSFSNCGGRVGSGQLSQQLHRSQFYGAEVWVTSTVVDANYADRIPKFRQFGDKRSGGHLTFRIPNLEHPTLNVDGVDVKYDTSWNPRYSYSTFFRLRRRYYGWHAGRGDLQTVLWRGDDSSQQAPKLFVQRQNDKHAQHAGRDWTSTSIYTGAEVRWHVTSTTGTMTGQFGSNIKLTFGKWHHIGLVVDKHVMTTYLDGEIQYVKPFTGGGSMVSWFGTTKLHAAYHRSPAGNELHDVRHFSEHSLSHDEMQSNGFYEYPPKACGNGYRNIGEECDDGNMGSDDGCNSQCKIEENYVCKGGNTTYLAADVCNTGNYNIHLTFETDKNVGDVVTSVYLPDEWSKDARLPVVEDTRYVGDQAGSDTNEEVSRRQGTTVLEVGPEFARSGSNGLRVRVRNRFNTGEYKSDGAEQGVDTLDDVRSKPSSAGWTNVADDSALDETVDATATNVLSDTWVYGPWDGTTAGTSVNGVRKSYTSLDSHSLVHVQFTYILVGGMCISSPDTPTYLAVDIDGDTGFAQARQVLDTTTPLLTFRDTLKDGSAYGPTYVAPKTDPKSPLTHYGYTAWDSEWKSASFELGSKTETGTYYKVDFMVPHSKSKAAITIRYVPSGCSLGNGEVEKWAVGDLLVKTLKTTTKAPFRPWLPMSAKGAGSGTAVPNTHTWLRFDTSENIKTSDYLAYSFRIVKWPQVQRGWAVELSNLDHNNDISYDMSNSQCRSTAECGSITGCSACRNERHSAGGCQKANNCLVFYRLCYSWKGLNDWPCDETQRPTRGVWHDESINIYEKFSSRYKNIDSSDAMKLRVQFVFSSSSPYGADQDIEIHFDDIKVGGVSSYNNAGANGCGNIELKSETSVTDGNKGMEIKINGIEMMTTSATNFNGLNQGFCYVKIPRADGDIPTGLSVTCLDPDSGTKSLGAVIDTFNDGDRVLLVSFGDNVKCGNNPEKECAQSLERLGGIAVQWPPGSSLAFVGRVGATPGSMPVRTLFVFSQF